jgi:outer membrane protein TolC
MTLAATLAAALTLAAGPEPAAPEELSLDAALRELEARSPGLAQVRGRVDEADARAAQARAPLVPSLFASAGWVRNRDEARFGLGPPLVPVSLERLIQPEEAFTVAGSVRVPLVVPGAWYELAAARAGERAAAASAEAALRDARAGLAQAAYAARAVEEVVTASEHAVRSAEELARSAERRVAAGTAAPLDALKARTEQVRRESDLARARAELGRVRLALGVALGREGPVRIAVLDEPPGGAPGAAADGGVDLAGVRDEALGARPELAARRAQRELARAQVRAGWARLAPELSATGSVFAQDVPLPTGKEDGWRATVDLVWTIFDGGRREGRRREAEARAGSARAAEEAERLRVVQEVGDASRDLAVARERLRLAETQRRLAAEAAASARRSFDAGVASSLDVIDANDRLYLADVGLAEGRARLAQATIALDRAAGRRALAAP